jgi:hypothetical protein
MTMTTTNRKPRSNGVHLTPESMTFTVPADAAHAFPADVLEVIDTLARVELEHNEAHGDLYRHQQAEIAAVDVDAAALADAIQAGKPDPGPQAVTEARAKVAEARRRVDALALVVRRTRMALHEALSAADRKAIAATLYADVLAERDAIHELTRDLEARYQRIDRLSSVLGAVDAFPSAAVGRSGHIDFQDAARGLAIFRTHADAQVHAPYLLDDDDA